jgi:hypothetical protein
MWDFLTSTEWSPNALEVAVGLLSAMLIDAHLRIHRLNKHACKLSLDLYDLKKSVKRVKRVHHHRRAIAD